jgi:methyl-accepting chemotaxis protein
LGEIVKIWNGEIMDRKPDRSLNFEPLIRRIDMLSRSTEEDFLTIGSDLQDVSQRSREISKNALAASTIMAGDEIRGAIEGLDGMITQLEGIFHKADKVSSRNIDSLRSIGKNLRAVKDELTGLKETSRDLKMLALSTKIQSTKTGESLSAFMQLGNDIGEMSGIIASKSSDLMEDTAALGELVSDVHGSLNDLRGQHQFQTGNVVKGAQNIIEGLNFLSAKSGEEVDQITSSSKAITSSIEEMVVSVQFQDITRQSLDRVISDLRKAQEGSFRETFQEISEQPDEMVPSDDIILVGVCKKQSKCLLDTGENISSAVQNMIINLDTVIRNIESMTAVTGKASKESSQFLKELETGMSSVTTFLSEVVKSGKEMSDSMSSLANTVDGMSEYTEDIEMISSEVELIALNARVIAAQVGAGGAGMSVIAGAVQKTANDSGIQRQTLNRFLQEVALGSRELKGEIENTSAGEGAQFDQLVRELGVFLDALRIMQNRIVSMLDDIDVMSLELHEKISRTTGKIRIHERVQLNVMEITRELEKTAEKLCESISAEDMYQLAGEKFNIQDLYRLGPSQKLAIIKDHFTENSFLKCFEEERNHAAEDDVVLF